MAIDGVLASTEAMVITSVEILIEENPMAFYELVSICRDPDHRLFGNTAKVLQDLNLLQPNGKPHDVTRDVVLHHVTGDGLNMALV
jgi:hypothetical protein